VNKQKRNLFGIVSAIVILAALGAVSRVAFRPQMPSQWHKLHVGMSLEEVHSTAVGSDIFAFDSKGVQIFTQETSMFGVSSCWQLFVTYGATGLSSADARFVNRRCGLLSRSFRSVL
jgi:hypothetical protein